MVPAYAPQAKCQQSISGGPSILVVTSRVGKVGLSLPLSFFWTLFENTQYSQIAELVAEGIDVHPVDVLPHNFCCPLLSCFGEVLALHLLQDLQGAGKAQDPEKGTVTGSDLKSQPCRSASTWELRNYRWVKIDLHRSLGKVAATATGSKKGEAPRKEGLVYPYRPYPSYPTATPTVSAGKRQRSRQHSSRFHQSGP